MQLWARKQVCVRESNVRYACCCRDDVLDDFKQDVQANPEEAAQHAFMQSPAAPPFPAESAQPMQETAELQQGAAFAYEGAKMLGNLHVLSSGCEKEFIV
jgi:hypothetical protein